MRLLPLIAALSCALPACASQTFMDLDFAAASARAKAEDKLLLVDITSAKAPLARKMDAQTWPDAAVTSWVREHAVAIRVDADAQPELAQSLGFTNLPTVILFKGDDQLGRAWGYSAPDEFVEWAGGKLAKRNEADSKLAAAKALLRSNDISARATAAVDAYMVGADALALQHYVWVWPMRRQLAEWKNQPLWVFMSSLAERYPPAREVFLEFLTEAQDNVYASAEPDPTDWSEWTSLCQRLHETPRILAWYDAHRDTGGRLFDGDPVAGFRGLMMRDVFDALVDAGRLRDAAHVYASTQKQLNQIVLEASVVRLQSSLISNQHSKAGRDYADKALREALSTLYGVTLADGRPQDATTVATQLLASLDDAASRYALVRRALDLSAARPPDLARWLDEAGAMNHEDPSALRARLTAVPSAASSK